MSHLAYVRGFIDVCQLSTACLNNDIQRTIQGSRHEGQPAEMLRMQQELAGAHKLVAHLKIELDAAHGRLDIFRLQPLLLYYPINARLSMSYE